jgi:hypothetical protein
MPSITTWNRLEPKPRSGSLSGSLEARIHDPAWLLARQWQFGEFHGEDNGSPIIATIQAERSQLSRYLPDKPSLNSSNTGEEYVGDIPLETLVEREPILNSNNVNYKMAAEAGIHFFRLLGPSLSKKYRSAFLLKYSLDKQAIQDSIEQNVGYADNASLRFLDVMNGRVLDGKLLYEKLTLSRQADGTAILPQEPPFDSIEQNDKIQLIKCITAWLAWYESLYGQTYNKLPWVTDKMNYEFAVSTPMRVSAEAPKGELVLVGTDYKGGHLDWHSFDVDNTSNLGSAGKLTDYFSITVVPKPVSFRGMPSTRWWEFEDRSINFGSVDAAPDDLAKLLLLEFALIYNNDFFIIPIDMPVGSICRTYLLDVTDTFGNKTQIKSTSEVNGKSSPWQMFRLSSIASSVPPLDSPDFLFIPPVLATSLKRSESIEEVLFLRDEMANMAWAVERVVESPIGEPLKRFEESQGKRAQTESSSVSSSTTSSTTTTTTTTTSSAKIAYQLMSSIPENWIPLVPVKIGGSDRIGLQRYYMMRIKPDGSHDPIKSRGVILEPDKNDLILNEEEVPRAGLNVTRSYRYTRWTDGGVHLWIGRRKSTGRGEGSSGLRFDIVKSA